MCDDEIVLLVNVFALDFVEFVWSQPQFHLMSGPMTSPSGQ